MKKIISTTTFVLLGLLLIAQSVQWEYEGQRFSGSAEWKSNVLEPLQYSQWTVSYEDIKERLWKECVKKDKELLVHLPGPEGQTMPFFIKHAPVAHPKLQAKFPEIRTFRGFSAMDPQLKANITMAPNGIKAILNANHGTYYITPTSDTNPNSHATYYHEDYPTSIDGHPLMSCEVEEHDDALGDFLGHHGGATKASSCEDLPLLKYRLAVACTGEFANKYGGTVSSAMAEIIDIVNKSNFVFLRDGGILMELVPNNDELVYLNSGSDPYTNGNTGAMLGENQPVIDEVIGNDNYDIGHVFGTNAGGLARLSSVCDTGAKALGVSCQFGVYANSFFYLIVCHEIGHQFSATHTFNFCNGNESPGTAYEPGSGNTIMGYAGAGCALPHNQTRSDPYFHINSIERIRNFSRNSRGISCAEEIPTDNDCPVIDLPYEDGFYIPKKTPFELTGNATDADGDDLTYTWEQYNLGPPIPRNESPSEGAPGFRFNSPDTNRTRIFPNINLIRRQIFDDPLDYLPDTCQDLNFRFTARDNNEEVGTVVWEEVSFKVACESGPFRVLQPGNTPANELYGGFKNIIRWDPGASQEAPVDCKSVDIMISTDDGFTYPDTLASGVSNDGSALVFVPEEYLGERNVRLKIKCSDNIFFNISPDDLLVTAPTEPGYQADVEPTYQDICLPDRAQFKISTESYLDYDSTLSIDYDLSFTDEVFFNLRQDSIVPGEDLVFDVEFGDFPPADTLVVDFHFYRGQDTIDFRSLIRVTSNNFDDLQALGPVDGASEVNLLPSFSWTSANNADEYLFQVANNASFDDDFILYEEITTDTMIEGPTTLDPSDVYFWRVFPSNRCGFDENPPISAFASINYDCEDYDYNGSQIRLPGNRAATTVIDLPIPETGSIIDINVNNIRLNHTSMTDLTAKLRSPSQTEVTLWSSECGNLQDVNASFDDDASSEFNCLFFGESSTNPMIPTQPLNTFHGENFQGNWQLILEDPNFSGGGEFYDVELEVCTDKSVENPVKLTNDTLVLQANTEKAITPNELLYQNENINDRLIIFQVMNPVTKGELYSGTRQIVAGQAFRLSSLLSGDVIYRHMSENQEFDQFTFIVYSLEGGWAGVQDTFNIKTVEMVNTKETPNHSALSIYPNPNGQNEAYIDLPEGTSRDASFKVFSADGKIFNVPVSFANNQAILDIQNLYNGVYFVELHSGSDWFISKLIVNK